MIQCDIDAYPSRGLVGAGDTRINITAFSFLVTIEINNVTQSDGGEYFCHAENSLASATAVTSVELKTEDERPHFSSLAACCKCCNLRNVSVDDG